MRRDLDDMDRYGFNWLRVWATWDVGDQDVSAVGADGGPREPFLGKLKWLVAECDRRGLIVDVTLTRSADRIANMEAHQRAVEVIVQSLKPHRNWYLDLANERDVRDARYVSPAELKQLRELVRRLDSPRLVTASFGGHDLSEQDVRESLLTIGLDFLTPHRPRNAQSPAQTEARTRECLALTKRLGRPAPVHHQEPFRRGYGRWEPTADDFLTDLRGAIAGGAAGWCFHNGSQRNTAENRPAAIVRHASATAVRAARRAGTQGGDGRRIGITPSVVPPGRRKSLCLFWVIRTKRAKVVSAGCIARHCQPIYCRLRFDLSRNQELRLMCRRHV